MIYYLLIVLSVILFGGSFWFKDIYRKKRGSGLKISMEATCIGAIAGLVILFIVSGFSFEFTGFTLLMAFLASLNSIAFAYCSFKALDYINLSLFSLFAMLGGMVLPFLQGILFYSERLTLAKGACVLFISIALALTAEKGEKKNGAPFYVGVFLLNGMAGVLSKIFTASNLPKTSSVGYSIWISITTALLSGILWLSLSLSKKHNPSSKESINNVGSKTNRLLSYGIGAMSGAINRVANFLLVFALLYVEVSVQFPMVTGGTMIVSTLLCFLGDKKPNKKEILSVLLAFIGTLLLFIIPI